MQVINLCRKKLSNIQSNQFEFGYGVEIGNMEEKKIDGISLCFTHPSIFCYLDCRRLSRSLPTLSQSVSLGAIYAENKKISKRRVKTKRKCKIGANMWLKIATVWGITGR